MDDQHNFRRAENAISALIAVILMGSLAWYFVSAAYKGLEVRRVLELQTIADTVTIFEIHKDEYPVNAAGLERWCKIGASYNGTVCLGELVKYGYFSKLPVSPNDSPYYYRMVRGRRPEVATPVNTTYISLPPENTCYGNYGEIMWCQKVR